ncbi:MAG: hypothetical protein ACK5VA_08185 [Pseudanabaena sp.]|jgi:hypothetical protein|nr:hypothetical protein [Pseudanabaena sp. M090S1SP2A07QC]MCA6506391.1 hypothetical protein [Pseudanabaena sp. M172S2SP2A07QC]MCA6518310.1 hypothetical protein [Pseudanabaena sp. M110S1SP2A07QC]MCA6520836.1 hypothetical protein [Pseudanabaena sp. M051S1SP2A07QC]MCA6525758.1 hypothetical protein [Pseudanabaena sp. M179S2SP2A07QC]MCA6528641.1 hypothetical protein [Pseudanabaena sp. M125S2SP2A07QC]MCA6536275.1 hypothetical protein [Pseudanabaena sp. M176S2SP2A07QC]MCA6539520.1 hypothetical prot
MLIDKDDAVFSQTGRLQKEIVGALNASIFNDAKVELNKVKMYKSIQITINISLHTFMAWLSRSREFIPLLLETM